MMQSKCNLANDLFYRYPHARSMHMIHSTRAFNYYSVKEKRYGSYFNIEIS